MDLKRPNILSAILLVCCFGILQCDREEISPREFPILKMIDQIIQTEEGIRFSGEISKLGNSNIVEKGFVWSSYADPTIYSPHVSVNEPGNTGRFQLKTTFDYQKNYKYKVRAFVRDSKFVVYSNTIEFESTQDSPAPVITGFWPEKAQANDTIKIIGKNLSFLTFSISVLFGDMPAYNIASTDSTIFVKVPEPKSINPVNLKVNINNNIATSSNQFNYIKPEILDFFPKNGTFLDTITIVGSNFPVNTTTSQIKFDGLQATLISQTPTAYKVIVPTKLAHREAPVTVIIGGVTKDFSAPFVLNQPQITNISPDVLNLNNRIVKITGNNFNPDKKQNEVKFEEDDGEILSCTKNEIYVKVPFDLKQGIYKLFITIGGMTVIPDKEFTYNSPWTQKAYIGSVGRSKAAGFVINNKGYIGTGENYSGPIKDFWEYDPSLNTWTKKADFGGQSRYSAFGFSLNNLGYIGSGTTSTYSGYLDFWEYNPSLNTWAKRTDFSGYSTNYTPTSFSGTEIGYVFYSKELYAYSEQTNSWTKKNDLPTGYNYMWEAAGFKINNKIYVCTGWDGYTQTLKDDLWEYDITLNTWTKRAPFPGGRRTKAAGFALNGKGYVGLGQKSDYSMPTDFWEYDPQTNTWERIPDFAGGPRQQPVSFVINGKAYIGTGYFNGGYLNDLWEFDPSK